MKMAEILSQSEIDELLNALQSGEFNVTDIQKETEEKKVRVYDFRRPHKFAKDQLRTMEVIYENYSRLMASYLSGVLRSFCQVEVISVEPQTYYEFINSLPEPVVLGIIDFRSLNGSAIMEISPDIAFAIIDKLLGGPGRVINNSKARDFTEIEISLIRQIVNQLTSLMDEPWANVITTDFRLERIETNPQFAQIISPNETIAIITMNISIGDIEGIVNICIPHMVIEPIADQLSTKYWFSSGFEKDKDSSKSELLAKKIKKAYVDIKAVIGTTEITVRDFIGLQIGDVIRLNKKAGEEIPIVVGGQEKFKGIIGTKNSRYAVQITAKKGGGREDE
jgi:flagellar motor switch protein FliM